VYSYRSYLAGYNLNLLRYRVDLSGGCSKQPSSKAAVSEEARRYLPHFVRPFALHMIPGERKNPLSVLGPSGRYPHVEYLSEVRTPLADFFSILFEARSPFENSIRIPALSFALPRMTRNYQKAKGLA